MVILGIGDKMTIKQLLKIFYEFIKDMGITITPIITVISFIYLYKPWQEIFEPYFIQITIFTLLISIIFPIIKRLYLKCRSSFRIKFNSPVFEIEIKYGDLFKEKSNIVIGFSNYFDTQMPEVISPNSVQGQFEQLHYKDNLEKLNTDILNALKRKKYKAIRSNTEKINGKKLELPIGTSISIFKNDCKFFLTAYSKMNDRCMAESNIEFLTKALNELWNEVRASGQCNPIAMPVLGSGLARILASKKDLLYLILLSFITNSKEQIITKKLTIVLNEKDKDKFKLNEIETFLKNLQG